MSPETIDIQRLYATRNVNGLIVALEYADKDVRREAAEALGKIGGMRALAALEHVLIGYIELAFAEILVGAIRQITIDTVTPFIQGVEDEQTLLGKIEELALYLGHKQQCYLFITILNSWTYRYMLMSGQVTDPISVAWCWDAIQNRKRAMRAAVAAAYALGVIRDKKAESYLADVLEKDEEEAVRKAAAWALEQIDRGHLEP